MNYKELFWGEDSFHSSLEDDSFWDYDKYWELEIALLEIAKEFSKNGILDKDLYAELFFLGLGIHNIISCALDENDIVKIDNLNDGDLLDYRDRFFHLMRIVLGKLNYKEEEYFFKKNPYFTKRNLNG